MPKVARRILIVVAALLLMVLGTTGAMYWASRQVPDFYQQNLVIAPSDTAEADLEQQALSLHNQLQHAGAWEARFTADQINSWLANDLPYKCPWLLPSTITDPRIVLEDHVVRLAARYRRGSVDTIISLTGEAYLTAQPNEVAIRIQQARAGYLPLPLGQFLDDIRLRAERADISLRWTEQDGDPVALIKIPHDHDLPGRSIANGSSQTERLMIERLALEAGEFVIAGRIESVPDHPDQSPGQTATVQSADNETHER